MADRQWQWKAFFARLYERTFDAEVLDRSAQVAFYFSFSIFPFLFFLLSLFGLVLDNAEAFRDELYAFIDRLLPLGAAGLVKTTVNEIVQASTTGKVTFGLALTLWSASAGVDSLRTALNAIYGLKETHSWWRTKLRSIALTVLFITIIFAALALFFFGWQIAAAVLARLGLGSASPLLLTGIRWTAMAAVMLLACEIVYNLVPSFRTFRWYWITPGSIPAILLWLIVTNGFSLYLDHFNTYNRAYGSLGAAMVLILWLWMNAVVVLVGGVINAVVLELAHEKGPTATSDGET